MLISLFTPTHDPKFLVRLSESVKKQSYDDLEWIVVPNGNTTVDDLLSIDLDPRIRILPYTGTTQNIGELKHFATSQAKGHVVAEVDHDDELTPDCVAEVAKAFQNETIDFVYSNCCEIQNGKSNTYDAVFGWQYRHFRWNSENFHEVVAFDPNPASFSKIWFAPNHIRAWKKSFYDSIGGHNSKLAVCDDHDLLCRTYINGNVKHINKCLYIYHLTGQNTCTGEKNGLIQELTLQIHDTYIYSLVERWCDLNDLMKIDLCGGFDPPPGYVSVDKFNGDVTADLDEKWTFENNSVGLIRAHDALEHMKDPIHVMKEAYRVLANKGWLLSLTPSTDGRGAFQDPTHKSFYNSNSFFYYTKREQARYINTPVRFQLNRVKNFYPSEWHKLHEIVYVKADLYKFDPLGRTCGLVEI